MKIKTIGERWFAGALVGTALTAASCGGSTTTSGTQTTNGCDAKGAQVAVVPHFQSPFTQQFIVGAQAAATECNAKLVSGGPQGIDTPAQITQFKDFVTTGAKAIVVVAYPSALWVNPINQAVAKGVQVGTVDVASPFSKELIMAGPKESDFGRELGRATAAALGPNAKGTWVTGICFPGLDVLENRVTGFTEIMNQMEPNVTVAKEINVTFDPAQNFSAWQRLMQQNPNAIGVTGVCDGDADNIIKVRSQQGGKWMVTVAGGLDPTALKAVKDGQVAVLVDAQPFLQGYTAMRVLLIKLAGGNVQPGWIDTGIGTVTSANVDQITARENSVAQGYQQSRQFYAANIDTIFGNLSSSIKPFLDYLAP